MRPFLEVVTRCYARPEMLASNKAGLKAQTDPDWQQTLIVDEIGRGIAWAQAQLADIRPTGTYIWILDDDDVCIRPTLVEELKAIAQRHDPDVIMMRMDHGKGIIKPEDRYWGQFPAIGRIGVSAYVVRRELWLSHQDAWLPGRYESDFDFIAAVFASGPNVYWFDVVASRVQRVSKGAPE